MADDCQRINRTDCGESRGISPFGNRASPGFQSNVSSTWDLIGLYEIGVNRKLGYTGNGISGYDTVGFGKTSTSDAQFLQKQVLTAYATPDLWIGQLGLGTQEVTFRQNERVNSTLLNLKNNGIIPSLSFGYTAGASYRRYLDSMAGFVQSTDHCSGFTKVTASLTLGGYDQSRTSETITIEMSDDEEKPLTVGLQSIIVTNSLNGTFSLLHQAILAPIDSSVSELWLPTSVCEQFATAFGLQYHEPSGRYALSESTRSKLRSLAPKLTFTVSDGLVEGKTLNLDLPYASFDLEATYPIFPNATAYFPIRRAANESQFMIGRAFLQEAYLGVDFERRQFNISQTRFENPMLEADIVTVMPLDSNSNSTIDSQAPSGTSSPHLSPGVVTGVVISAVLGTLLIVGLFWFYWVRRPRDKAETVAMASTESTSRGPAKPEIMGYAVSELPAHHGQSEADPGKAALNELEGNSIVGVYELR